LFSFAFQTIIIISYYLYQKENDLRKPIAESCKNDLYKNRVTMFSSPKRTQFLARCSKPYQM